MSKFEKVTQLIGDETFNLLQNKKICLFGVGGVGGTALECLIRTGFTYITIVDFDIINETNLNRQILYTYSDVGKLKVDCAENRVKSINPDCIINKYSEKVDKEFLDKFSLEEFDYIIDAIDDSNAKVEIAKKCLELNKHFIMCLGMANRIDPSKVSITKLSKTENDPLAKKMRNLLRKENINLNNVEVVISKELPRQKSIHPASLMMVPSEAGLIICYHILEEIVK